MLTLIGPGRKLLQLFEEEFFFLVTFAYIEAGRLRWSSGQHTGHWNPSSKPPKPLDFSGVRKILSIPSFGGEVKESLPCPSFAACKKS